MNFVHQAAMAILLLPITATSPISANPADVALSSLEKRDSYTFNCYSPGQACRGTGDTSGGGESQAGRSAIPKANLIY